MRDLHADIDAAFALLVKLPKSECPEIAPWLVDSPASEWPTSPEIRAASEHVLAFFCRPLAHN